MDCIQVKHVWSDPRVRSGDQESNIVNGDRVFSAPVRSRCFPRNSFESALRSGLVFLWTAREKAKSVTMDAQLPILDLHHLMPSLRVVCVLIFVLNSSASAQQKLHFDFGPTKTQPGYKAVGSDTFYSKSLGYGFEPDAQGFLCRKHN